MRKIKFRVWGKEKKLWFSFYLSQNPKSWSHKLHDYPLQQYTGLKDCNFKEIYEGDIVKTGEEFGEVQYDEQQSAFIILFQPNNKKQKSGCATVASTWPSPVKEIIGNTYENPELLVNGKIVE